MKLKTIRIPRGYDGLHIEAPGVIVNIEKITEGMTRVDVNANGDRYAGEPEWWCEPSELEPRGIGIRIVMKDPAEEGGAA